MVNRRSGRVEDESDDTSRQTDAIKMRGRGGKGGAFETVSDSDSESRAAL